MALVFLKDLTIGRLSRRTESPFPFRRARMMKVTRSSVAAIVETRTSPERVATGSDRAPGSDARPAVGTDILDVRVLQELCPAHAASGSGRWENRKHLCAKRVG